MAATLLMLASAGILLVLGSAHLVYTFFGTKLLPRDGELQKRMSEVSPVITRETTMWRAWIGFKATLIKWRNRHDTCLRAGRGALAQMDWPSFKAAPVLSG
jgi:hypothetical protein